ncbi:hypothetical protein [Curtobacterium sp. BRD11]|nr:hypothetical protein [Curtobacterium sp. BRD11]MDT0209008.1 hypothetical protein [Curtobacterium sp. BRD11]
MSEKAGEEIVLAVCARGVRAFPEVLAEVHRVGQTIDDLLAPMPDDNEAW